VFEDNTPTPPPPSSRVKGAGARGWARELRRLYQAVVDEPLPDSFEHLLSQLDEADGLANAGRKDERGADASSSDGA